MKIIVGSGLSWQQGWRSFKQSQLDLLQPTEWARKFKPDSLDAILAEHVWEHLTEKQGLLAAQVCFRYLKPGGYLRIAVPDGLHPSPNYIAWVMPGSGFNGWDHKELFTFRSLSHLLEAAGYQVKLLEWWCDHKRFNSRRWKFEDGHIRRSTQDLSYMGILSLIVGAPYTSLIVDAVKPAKKPANSRANELENAWEGYLN